MHQSGLAPQWDFRGHWRLLGIFLQAERSADRTALGGGQSLLLEQEPVVSVRGEEYWHVIQSRMLESRRGNLSLAPSMTL